MEKMKTILLVEDNKQLLNNNRRLLEIRGYAVRTAASAREAKDVLSTVWPDLIIIDIMLPDESGLDLCREIRALSTIPIIFLTALGGSRDVVYGLKAGGDDYLSKPFDIDVLVARIEALLRRLAYLKRPEAEQTVVVMGNVRLDLIPRRAYVADRDILLTPTEFMLLERLVQKRDEFIAVDEFFREVWATPLGRDSFPVKQRIYSLRKKLAEGGKSGVTIESRRGMGYCIREITQGED